MHILMFADQHVETLGGAQVSTRLQRRHLERTGHTVTIVAPRRHGPRAATNADDPSYLDLPSSAVPFDREYSFVLPGRSVDRAVDDGLVGRPPVDIVHVQADYWGAVLGYRFAGRRGLPVVHTMHNRVDVGLRATLPFPSLVLRLLNVWRRWMLPGSGPGSDGWAYLRGLASAASAVTAPSGHFARRLEEHGVVPGDGIPGVDAIWNGMDDEVMDRMLAISGAAAPDAAAGLDGPGAQGDAGAPDVPCFVWIGRMSAEKRLLPFLEAVALADIPMRVEVIGGGAQLRTAKRLVARRGLETTVAFLGGLPYERSLERIARADALVQTSIGFETQGMTPFEAAALGTPSVISDPDIAAELGSGVWRAGDDPSVSVLAAALRRAAGDIRSDSSPVPDPAIRDRFRQSSRTAEMIALYERVIASSGGAQYGIA